MICSGAIVIYIYCVDYKSLEDIVVGSRMSVN